MTVKHTENVSIWGNIELGNMSIFHTDSPTYKFNLRTVKLVPCMPLAAYFMCLKSPSSVTFSLFGEDR
jgi:hypothetical protein